MIDAAILPFHSQNLVHLERLDAGVRALEKRIIGIDGNGTGREGVLQRQDLKLAELGDNQDRIEKKIDGLIHTATSWNKKSVWRFVQWAIGTILVMLGLIMGYLANARRHAQPISAIHAPSQTNDAGVDGR